MLGIDPLELYIKALSNVIGNINVPKNKNKQISIKTNGSAKRR